MYIVHMQYGQHNYMNVHTYTYRGIVCTECVCMCPVVLSDLLLQLISQ